MENTITIYYTITDVEEYLDEMKSVKDFNDTILEPNPERSKLYQLQKLYRFYTFVIPCRKAIEEFNCILKRVNDLNHEDIRCWVSEYVMFFRHNIFALGISFTDINGEYKENFFLPQQNLYIDRHYSFR